MSLKKNDIIKLRIDSASAEGRGVGRAEDGMAVFVPYSAVGDELNVRILKVKKSYAFGKIEDIVTPSAGRIEPDCGCFGKCGGCAWRHITYDEECRIKSERVAETVKRIGGFENVELEPILRSGNILRYRNKAQLPVGKDSRGNTVMGFYAVRSHRIVDCADCMLQPLEFTQIENIVRKFIDISGNDVYSEITGKGRLRHLYLRMGEITREIMVCLVVNGSGLKKEDLLVKMLTESVPKIQSIIVNVNREKTNVILGSENRTVYGRDYITDELCGLKFKISPFSFWQVNRAQAEKLYAKASEYAGLSPDEILLDLYCGTGTIGLTMAHKCKKLIGVEIVADAVKDACFNRDINNICNAEFICEDAPRAAQTLCAEGMKPDCVILDPPRKGCTGELIKAVSDMSPKRIVYVSCDPATLARDLREFSESGYIPLRITPCDMFSRTAHVECVVLLSRA